MAQCQASSSDEDLQSDKVPTTVGHTIQLHKVILHPVKDGRWLTHQLQQNVSPIVCKLVRGRKRRFKGFKVSTLKYCVIA